MNCPYCNKKIKMTQILLTKGSIKCSNCDEVFYISKLKLYMPMILSLIVLYTSTILKVYFDVSKNVIYIFFVGFTLIMIVYMIKIKPKK